MYARGGRLSEDWKAPFFVVVLAYPLSCEASFTAQLKDML